MKFDIFTLLPEVFPPYLNSSILAKAAQNRLIQVNVHDIRSFTTDKHHVTDDTPYGGGGGMVMKPEPVFTAVEICPWKPAHLPDRSIDPSGQGVDTRDRISTRATRAYWIDLWPV